MHWIVQELIFLVPCSLEPLSERCVLFVWNVVLILKVRFFFFSFYFEDKFFHSLLSHRYLEALVLLEVV